MKRLERQSGGNIKGLPVRKGDLGQLQLFPQRRPVDEELRPVRAGLEPRASGLGATQAVPQLRLVESKPEPLLDIAIAQVDVVAGRPDLNVPKMLERIKEAKAKGADVVVFPEMTVGGYLVGDKWNDDSFCEDLMQYNDVLRRASQGITVVWGNVYLDTPERQNARGVEGYHPNRDGRTRKFNAAFVAQNGRWVERDVDPEHAHIVPKGIQPKTLMANDSLFDDERYFFPLEDVAKDHGVPLESLYEPFQIEKDGEKVPLGIHICQDMWCSTHRRNGQPLNTAEMLVDNGAKQLINLSSSPAYAGKDHVRDGEVAFLKKEMGDRFVPFYYANHSGAQNNGKNFIAWDGASTAYGADGKPVAMAASNREELLFVKDVAKLKSQERPQKRRIAEKLELILSGIKHVATSCGWADDKPFVIGLSGGIDSAVSAALLHLAVGSDKIHAVNMPTQYNSQQTKDAAKQLADNLGIESYQVVPITKMVEANRELLQSMSFGGKEAKVPDILEENIQAKIRGTSILSNMAQMVGGVFVNNGNKLEVATGYATLYGDWGGAVAPLGDLTKAEVYELARYLNEEVFKREVIPESLLPDELFRFGDDKIKPSAELKEAQVDPMKIGYHDALLEAWMGPKQACFLDFLTWYRDGTLAENLGVSEALLERYGLDDPKAFVDDLQWLARQIDINVFKRVQSVPIIVTSPSAFGYIYRESILPHRDFDARSDTAAVKRQILAGCSGEQS